MKCAADIATSGASAINAALDQAGDSVAEVLGSVLGDVAGEMLGGAGDLIEAVVGVAATAAVTVCSIL